MRFRKRGPIWTINNFLRLRPKGLLHHYTISAGLIGIFESQTIWAASTRHLNDSEEYVHALKLLEVELKRRLDKETGVRKGLFAEWLNNMRTDEGERTFVASFSEKSDLLSQWRAYTHCDDAYCIGFNQEEVDRILSASDCTLVRCAYSIEQQKQLIAHLVDYL